MLVLRQIEDTEVIHLLKVVIIILFDFVLFINISRKTSETKDVEKN